MNLRSPSSSDTEGFRVNIEVLESNWRKIVLKHFSSTKEPWRDVFGSELVKASQSEMCNAKLLDALGQQVTECLDLPLLILYSCLGRDYAGVGRRWLLVLPCGAVAYVWEEINGNTLRSCYFKGTVGKEPIGDRLRTSIRQQIVEFAVFNKTTGNFEYPELKDHHLAGRDETERVFSKRFVSGGAWGFVAETPGSKWKLTAASATFARTSTNSWKES